MKRIDLPSGSFLDIGRIPFVEAKELYTAILAEMKGVPIQKDAEVMQLVKDMYCYAMSSSKVEELLWKCLGRCLYNGQGIDQDTFEDETARADYSKIVVEVIKDVVNPFVKDLYSGYKEFMGTILSNPE